MVLMVCAKRHLKMFEYDLCLAFNQNEKKTHFFEAPEI